MLPGFFIGLFIKDVHITLAIREQCTVADLQEMVNQMKFVVAPLLPLVISINPEITMKGKEGNVPTHDVIILDDFVRSTLEKVYSDLYTPGGPYPTWSPHITVDTDEKKKTVESFIGGEMAVVKNVQLRQLGFKETLWEITK